MKKLLSMLLAVALMVTVMPVAAFAANDEGDTAQITEMTGGILIAKENEAGICFELVNVPDNAKVYAELYAGTAKLVTKEYTFTEGGTKTCTFYTVGTSSTWTQNPSPWKAYDNIVPTHGVLYINDVKVDTCDVNFTEEAWIAHPGTNAAAITGGILVDRIAEKNEAGICFELVEVPDDSNVLVKLYDGEEELVSKSYSFTEGGTKTCTFYTVGTSSTWTQNPSPWKAYDHIMPTHGVLYIDGVEMGTCNVNFTEEAWIAHPGTMATEITGGILVDRMEEENEAGICFELVNVPDNSDVLVKLYDGEEELVNKSYSFTEGGTKTCTFYTVGTSSSWTQNPSPWNACDHVLPTHGVLYINGEELDACDVNFTEEAWTAHPGTTAETKLVGALAATCDKAGYTGDKVCVLCGETVEKGTVILATEKHVYKEGKCTVCGKTEVKDTQKDDSTVIPKTGDSSNVALWFTLLSAAVVLMGTTVVVRKRR